MRSRARQAFGTGSYGSTDVAGSGKKTADPWEFQRKNVESTVRFGAALPCLFFITLVGLFTYTSHHKPVLPWLAAVLGGIMFVIGSYPSAPTGLVGRRGVDFLPLAVSAASTVFGVLCGVWNVTNIEAYAHATFLNRYNGVLPDTNPLSVSDGGILDFAKGTVVDIESSAGYHAWPNTYCAAPIVMSGAETDDQSIGFWAVGMNCCDPRGRFACDDAEVTQARSGLLVNSHPLGSFTGQNVNEYFKRAVRMTAAEYGFEVAPNAVLVSWLEKPLETAEWSLKLASTIFVALIILAIASMVALAMLYSQIARLKGYNNQYQM